MGASTEKITARTSIDPWIKGQQRYITEDFGTYAQKPYEAYQYDQVADQGRLGEHARNVLGNLMGYRGQHSTLFQPVGPDIGGWRTNELTGRRYRAGVGKKGELHRTFGTQGNMYERDIWGGATEPGDPYSPKYQAPTVKPWGDDDFATTEFFNRIGVERPHWWDAADTTDLKRQQWYEQWVSQNSGTQSSTQLSDTSSSNIPLADSGFTAADRALLQQLIDKQSVAVLSDADRALLQQLTVKSQQAIGGGPSGVPSIPSADLGFTPYEDAYDPDTGFAGFGAGRADFGLGAQQMWDAADRFRHESGYDPVNVAAAEIGPQARALRGDLGDLPTDVNRLRAGVSGPTAADIEGYMNPYTEAVLGDTIADITERQKLADMNIAAAATSQGAFGGDRETLARNLSARDFERLKARETAKANQEAYLYGVGQAQRDVDRRAAEASQLYEGGLRGRLQEGADQTAIAQFNAQQQRLQQESDVDRRFAASLAQQQAGLDAAALRIQAAQNLGLGGQALQEAGFGAVNQLDALAARDAAVKQAAIDADIRAWYDAVRGPREDFAMRHALLQGLPIEQTETKEYPGQPLWQQITQAATGGLLAYKGGFRV